MFGLGGILVIIGAFIATASARKGLILDKKPNVNRNLFDLLTNLTSLGMYAVTIGIILMVC